MRLSGYSVNTDPNKSTYDRLKKIYEQLKIEEDPGEVKTFKPLTIEISHWSRRTWHIQTVDETVCGGRGR